MLLVMNDREKVFRCFCISKKKRFGIGVFRTLFWRRPNRGKRESEWKAKSEREGCFITIQLFGMIKIHFCCSFEAKSYNIKTIWHARKAHPKSFIFSNDTYLEYEK